MVTIVDNDDGDINHDGGGCDNNGDDFYEELVS